MISDEHLAMLAASGITVEHAMVRGYETVTAKAWFDGQKDKVTPPGRNVPGLAVPLRRADGSQWGHQYRPDNPRLRGGKVVKYETPTGQRNGLDVPPGVGPMLDDPEIPLWITEGVKKADCGALHGLCVLGLVGTYGWLGTNSAGGKMALADWRDVALNGRRVIIAFDGDIARKESVQKAASALGAYLAYKGARVEFLHLPDTDDKTGLDDYLMAHTVEELRSLVKPHQPQPYGKDNEPPQAEPEPKPEPVQPISLTQAHTVFRRWLGKAYDTDALDVCLAAVAVERFDDGSDPVWVLVISGPGAAKTETVQAFVGTGAKKTSSISSEAALLSATPERERAKDATGGLLRRLGERGVLVVKDVTSILSMNNDTRAKVLSALREVYDGHWTREVGVEGGRLLTWDGRIAVLGAVTTAWDAHHAVIATMGDRFVLVRIDSTKARIATGRQAIKNTGDEVAMRTELSDAVAGVIAGMNPEPITVTDEEIDRLLAAADLVTLARTGVEYDYRGNVIDAHAPEANTRFPKQLTQIVRGAVAVGMDRADAVRLAIRCARDSMLPMRMAIIDDLAEHPDSTPTEVRRRLKKPRATVDRQLQALHTLGVVDLREEGAVGEIAGKWHYSLAEGIDPDALSVQVAPLPEKSVGTHFNTEKGPESDANEREREEGSQVPTDFSGDGPTCANPPPPPPDNNPSMNGHAAYLLGLCKTCHAVPYRPGGTQCEDCFLADQDALDLVFRHLGATPVDPEESAS